jgi:hypothetical protein
VVVKMINERTASESYGPPGGQRVIGAHDGAGHGSEMASPSLTGGLATRR